jgi:hypothetical protein
MQRFHCLMLFCRELTASSALQFRSRFSSAKSDAYKVHALVRILFAQRNYGATDRCSATNPSDIASYFWFWQSLE